MKSWIFDSTDYYKENKKTRFGKQSKLPKPPRFQNRSKPKNVVIPRDFKHFTKASEIKDDEV